MVAEQQQAVLTHAMVAQEYASSAKPDPNLLGYMNGLASNEQTVVQQPQPAVETATETALTDFAQHREGHSPQPAEAFHSRAEISPRHHQEHLEEASFVPGIAERPEAEQDIIGELIEIGQEATRGNDLGMPELPVEAAGQQESTSEDQKVVEYDALEASAEFERASELAKYMANSKEAGFGPGTLEREALSKALDSVEWDNVPADKVDELIGEVAMFDREHEPLVDDEEAIASYSLTHDVLKRVPDKVLAELYKRPPINGDASELRTFIDTRRLNKSRAVMIGGVLGRLHTADGENVLLMPEGQDENLDKLREYIDFAGFEIEAIPDSPEDDHDQESIFEYENKVVDIMRDVLRNKLKINPALSKKMGTAMTTRLRHAPTEETPPYFNGTRVKHSLRRMKEVVENVFPVNLERLTTELGVVNLDMYKPEDLHTLSGLLEHDEETIKYLQDGDVTVVFVDAYGDHNGALTPVFDAYRKESGRTLMFEVAQPGDFYRRMVMLKRLGVKPSSMVVAAHGAPGETHFGQGDSGFVLAANRYVTQMNELSSSVNIDESRLDRLVSDEFMQSSRGIDDPEERIGRRTVILNSCSSDMAYKGALPSSVETIVRTIGRADVDGYGAATDMYLERGRGEATFYGKEQKRDGTSIFVPNGTRVSINERPSLRDKARAKLTGKEMFLAGQNISEELKNGELLVKRTTVKSIKLSNLNAQRSEVA